MLRPDHILCARLERMTVSTWNMMVWARMMTSDLVWMASKVSKTNGTKGAHGLGKLELQCFELFALARVRAPSLTSVLHPD